MSSQEGPELLELLDAHERGRTVEGLHNLVRRGPGGTILCEPLRPLLERAALDALPDGELHAYGRYPAILEYYRHMFPVAASRGCPMACSYCFNERYRELYRGKGRAVRWRSPERSVAELTALPRRYAVTHFVFEDDAFLLDPAWFRAFAPLYHREVGLPFTCQAIARVRLPSNWMMSFSAATTLWRMSRRINRPRS